MGRAKQANRDVTNQSVQVDGNELPELPQSVKPKEANRKMVIEEQCVLTVDGKTYDLTKWADQHPGGSLIRQYNGLDATHIFNAFHSPEAHARLAQFKPLANPPKHLLPPPKDPRSQDILEKFENLKKEFQDEGFFETSYAWYFYKCFTTLVMAPLGLYFQYHGSYLLSAIFFGIFWQQLGWIGHEFAHHQIFQNNRKLNDLSAIFFGNICQGFSSHWWKDRHNSHHATTNILDADPDIDNIPMMAWSSSDLDKAPAWTRKTIPYQAYYFLFLLPLLRVTWCLNSIFFVRDMAASRYKRYNVDYRLEAIGLAIHWTWVLLILIYLPTWGWRLTWFLVSELLAGFGIAIVVFFNHYSCDKYPSSLAGNFVCLQLWTTRNMTPGLLTDWICGGLNYQIEHHLFPTMPRHNLNRASAKVKAFCRENNLPYLCSDFYAGLLKVLHFLNSIGQIAKERNDQAAERKIDPKKVRATPQ
jgi:delta8-fatty-acid desaturase